MSETVTTPRPARCELSQRFYFEAAHTLERSIDAAGSRRIHGHTYHAEVTLLGNPDPASGMLVDLAYLRREVERAGLKVLGSIEFGKSYSQTLRRWHETFNDRWSEVASQGFDDRFRRMWNFYLTSCAGAFEGGNCDVTQITIARPA